MTVHEQRTTDQAAAQVRDGRWALSSPALTGRSNGDRERTAGQPSPKGRHGRRLPGRHQGSGACAASGRPPRLNERSAVARAPIPPRRSMPRSLGLASQARELVASTLSMVDATEAAAHAASGRDRGINHRARSGAWRTRPRPGSCGRGAMSHGLTLGRGPYGHAARTDMTHVDMARAVTSVGSDPRTCPRRPWLSRPGTPRTRGATASWSRADAGPPGRSDRGDAR